MARRLDCFRANSFSSMLIKTIYGSKTSYCNHYPYANLLNWINEKKRIGEIKSTKKTFLVWSKMADYFYQGVMFAGEK